MIDHVPEPPIAASETKHLPILHHPIPGTSIIIPLKQLSSSASSSDSSGTATGTGTGTGTETTGTTLWLSSQLLALYFASLPPPRHDKKHRQRVLDLGSGIGFLPLCLASRGYKVIATDVPSVIDSVLSQNISTGLSEIKRLDTRSDPDVQVTTLDWETVAQTGQLPDSVNGKIDMLITSDTIYAPHLVRPLFETLRIISFSSSSSSSSSGRGSGQPTIYITLERRDSTLVDSALEIANDMGLALRRVDRGKIDRLRDEAGWNKDDWDDVEIWKGKFTRASFLVRS
jgi:hypothetical protein